MVFAWTFVVVAVPFLLGVAVSLLGLKPPEFWAARVCVLFSAILTIAVDGLWFHSSSKILIVKSATSIPICVVSVIGCYAALIWINSKQRTYTEESNKKKEREKLKSDIGQFLADAGRLYSLPDNPENDKLIKDWILKVYNLLFNVLGMGEANLFVSDSGYVFYVSDNTPKNETLLDGRMRRLTELVARL
jgi:hypothetical protein